MAEQVASWRVWIVTGGAAATLGAMVVGGVAAAVVLARSTVDDASVVEDRGEPVPGAAQPVVSVAPTEAASVPHAAPSTAPSVPVAPPVADPVVAQAAPPSRGAPTARSTSARRAPATQGSRSGAPASPTPAPDPAPAPAGEPVRLVVRAGPRARDVTLTVDSRDAGALPATVSVTPGAHTLHFSRADGDLDLTCTVEVGDGGRAFEFDGRRARCPG